MTRSLVPYRDAMMGTSHQFRLRTLLGVVLGISIVLATTRVGILPCIALGCPLGGIAFLLFRRGSMALPRRPARAWRFAFIALAITGLCPMLGWWPANSATWIFLAGVNAWQILLLILISSADTLVAFYRVLLLLPACAGLYPFLWVTVGSDDMPSFLPEPNWYLVEWRMDVHRVTLWPEFDFRKEGYNHALLKSYAPPGKEVWVARKVLGPGHLLAGGDYVRTRNALLRSWLPRILALLPSEDARRAVVAALADGDNFARIHQGLLLTWLACDGLPDGVTRERWWQDNWELFSPIRDSDRAAKCFVGLSDAIRRLTDERRGALSREAELELGVQLKAARNQEVGLKGGDEAFGDSFMALTAQTPESVRAARVSAWRTALTTNELKRCDSVRSKNCAP